MKRRHDQVQEKFNRPHYPLEDVHQLIEEGNYLISEKARDAIFYELEMTEQEAVDVVLSLTNRDFFKSMTVKGNHKMWQDVYKPERDSFEYYIKLQIDDGSSIIISFKEK